MRFVLAAAFATFVLPSGTATACELRLLLSWDVSASMTEKEHYLQRHGTAQEFRDPAVQNAISLIPDGVAVSVLQWAGPEEQVVSLDWTMLHDGHDVARMAAVVESIGDPFDTRTGTAVGNGLRAARTHLQSGPQDCERTVIDISGDGHANVGIAPSPEADMLVAAGVTINALVLPEKWKSFQNGDDPFMFYVHEVARSPDSFVIDVVSYEDYWRALRMKLLRELTPYVARAY